MPSLAHVGRRALDLHHHLKDDFERWSKLFNPHGKERDTMAGVFAAFYSGFNRAFLTTEGSVMYCAGGRSFASAVRPGDRWRFASFTHIAKTCNSEFVDDLLAFIEQWVFSGPNTGMQAAILSAQKRLLDRWNATASSEEGGHETAFILTQLPSMHTYADDSMGFAHKVEGIKKTHDEESAQVAAEAAKSKAEWDIRTKEDRIERERLQQESLDKELAELDDLLESKIKTESMPEYRSW